MTTLRVTRDCKHASRAMNEFHYNIIFSGCCIAVARQWLFFCCWNTTKKIGRDKCGKYNFVQKLLPKSPNVRIFKGYFSQLFEQNEKYVYSLIFFFLNKLIRSYDNRWTVNEWYECNERMLDSKKRRKTERNLKPTTIRQLNDRITVDEKRTTQVVNQPIETLSLRSYLSRLI